MQRKNGLVFMTQHAREAVLPHKTECVFILVSLESHVKTDNSQRQNSQFMKCILFCLVCNDIEPN